MARTLFSIASTLRGWVLLSYVLATRPSTAAQCPAPEDIFPCRCVQLPSIGAIAYQVICSGVEEPTRLRKALRAFAHGGRLKLRIDFSIVDLTDSAADGPFFPPSVSVVQLKLSSSRVVWPTSASSFRGQADTLEEITLWKSALPRGWAPLSALRNLRALQVMECTPWARLPRMFDDLPASLRTLKVTGKCCLGDLARGAMRQLDQLDTLDVENTRLSRLRVGVLPERMTNLKHLHLQ